MYKTTKVLDTSITKFLNDLRVRKTFLTRTQNPEAIITKTDVFDYIYTNLKIIIL